MLKRIVFMLAMMAWAATPAARAQEAGHDVAHDSARAAHDAAKSAVDAPRGTGEALQGEGHAGTHEQPPLLPDPFDRTTQLQALWVVIIFLVLLAILYKTAWKNILIGLKNREQRIRKDIVDAEAARTRAEGTLKQYNDQLAAAEGRVREMLAKATLDAEKLATTIRMQAQNDAEQIKERTTRELEIAAKQAKADFREYAATVATNAAEQILRRNLNEQDQRDLVNRSLDQLESVSN